MSRFIRIVDTTLRDGSHAVSHQYTPEAVGEIAAALDAAGVDTVEVSHGDGLGGSTYQYGFSYAPEEEYLKAASAALKKSKMAVLLLPGIGTVEDLERAAHLGARVVRVATHVTEADVGEQHVKAGKQMGLEVMVFLMMAHMVDAAKVVEQARLFESYGADVIYLVDSAGAMVPAEAAAKVRAMKEALSVPVGIHTHNNLGLAIGNSLAGIEAGADVADGSCKGMGAGSGNAQTEVLVAVLKKLGYETGVDLYRIMDAADDVVARHMKRPQVIDRNSLSLGYAGVYSSFMLHSLRAAEKFGLDARDILVELGRRKTVGGQEDMIVDVAYEMTHKKQGAKR